MWSLRWSRIRLLPKRLFAALAEEVGVSIPATSIAREMLRAAKSQGKGEMDSCIVMTVIEALADMAVKTPD